MFSRISLFLATFPLEVVVSLLSEKQANSRRFLQYGGTVTVAQNYNPMIEAFLSMTSFCL